MPYLQNMERILHTQTILHGQFEDKEGNCTQAAVATLLGLPLDDVPDFNNIHKDKPHSGWFWNHLRTFFLSKGYHLETMGGRRSFSGLYMASGPTIRGTQHIVVMHDGALYHDPHPSRAGILEVKTVYVPLPIDPMLFQPVEGAELPADMYDFDGNVIGPDIDGYGSRVSDLA